MSEEPITIKFDDDGLISNDSLDRIILACLRDDAPTVSKQRVSDQRTGFVYGFRCLERLAKTAGVPVLLFLENLTVVLRSVPAGTDHKGLTTNE